MFTYFPNECLYFLLFAVHICLVVDCLYHIFDGSLFKNIDPEITCVLQGAYKFKQVLCHRNEEYMKYSTYCVEKVFVLV